MIDPPFLLHAGLGICGLTACSHERPDHQTLSVIIQSSMDRNALLNLLKPYKVKVDVKIPLSGAQTLVWP